jgi:hypothetical protein
MSSLLLDEENWDLTVDTAGNIAVTTGPYAMAQDVASAVRLFLGELYYDTTQGVPYWESILGKFPPASFIKAKLVEAALTVPGVVTAKCFLSSFENRVFQGQVQFTDRSGVTLGVTY